ncbi:MAG: hypothetical protein KAW47_00245 [Thermoplasmatales archaeon]|nr:hypothetical protein [Thermoplasmatales archaeon]
MRKIAIGILIVGLILAGVTGGFLVADYSYQKGYSSGYALGYSKGHFEGFTAGEAVQNNAIMCDLIERDIAYIDKDQAPQAAMIPYLDGNRSMVYCMYPRTDPRFGWDASWVCAGWECTKHRNEIVDMYREDHWAGYIK